jgi:hypothetical protein
LNILAVGRILKEVIKWGPPVSVAGKKIYDNVKIMFADKAAAKVKHDLSSADGLETRLAQLEQNDLEQAKLLSQVTQQTNYLSQLINILSRRILYIFILSFLAFIISIILLIRNI